MEGTSSGTESAGSVQAPGAPPDVLKLDYETEFLEEKLADGTIRMTVAVERGRAIRGGLIAMAVGVAVSAMLVMLWLWTGWTRAGVLAVSIGPIAILMAGAVVLQQSMTPRRQSHVVEVNDRELRIHTLIAGDKVVRRHARGDVKAVIAREMALEIHTTRDEYSCIAFARSAHLKRLADRIHEVWTP